MRGSHEDAKITKTATKKKRWGKPQRRQRENSYSVPLCSLCPPWLYSLSSSCLPSCLRVFVAPELVRPGRRLGRLHRRRDAVLLLPIRQHREHAPLARQPRLVAGLFVELGQQLVCVFVVRVDVD